MFSSKSFGVITLLPESCDKQRYVRDTGAQSEARTFVSRSSLSTKVKSREVQTDDSTLSQPIDPSLVDWQDVSQFLSRVERLVTEALEENNCCHAFQDYDVDWLGREESIACTHTFSEKSVRKADLTVSSLDWNSTGSVLAASFSCANHEDWCTSKSFVCTWSIDRSCPPDKCHQIMEVPTSVLALKFHPVQPSTLIAATFNGEVWLGDLSHRQESLGMRLITSTEESSGIMHREPITQLDWYPDPEQLGKYLLVTSGSDGKIVLWQYRKHLVPVHCFLLLAESMPPALSSLSAKVARDASMGVTSVCFSPHDTSTYIVGSESGGIFRCSLNNHMARIVYGEQASSGLEIRSAAQFPLLPHASPVLSVHVAPFHRSGLLTCSADASIRIYNNLQMEPCLSLNACSPVFAAKWSPSRPMVFAAVTQDGQLLVYDLLVDKTAPVRSLKVNEKGAQVFTLAFNPKRPSVIVTGDSLGYVKVWRLDDSFSVAKKREADALEFLLTQE